MRKPLDLGHAENDRHCLECTGDVVRNAREDAGVTLRRSLSSATQRANRRFASRWPPMPGSTNQRGAAAVEFALLLPVLIMVLFGIIEFGIALSRQQVLATASREGARLGIRQSVPRPTAADIQALARRVFTQAGVTGVTPMIAVTGAGGPSGTDLIVTVSAPYQFYVMANVIPALRGTVTLRSRTVMRHE